DDLVVACFHVTRGEHTAVVEPHALAQLERIGEAVGRDRPGLGEVGPRARARAVRRVDAKQRVVHGCQRMHGAEGAFTVPVVRGRLGRHREDELPSVAGTLLGDGRCGAREENQHQQPRGTDHGSPRDEAARPPVRKWVARARARRVARPWPRQDAVSRPAGRYTLCGWAARGGAARLRTLPKETATTISRRRRLNSARVMTGRERRWINPRKGLIKVFERNLDVVVSRFLYPRLSRVWNPYSWLLERRFVLTEASVSPLGWPSGLD